MTKWLLNFILQDPNVSKLEDSTWEKVFSEFAFTPEPLIEVLEENNLFNVCLRFILKQKDSGFYKVEEYFGNIGDVDCVRSIEEASYFTPMRVEVGNYINSLAWYIAKHLVDDYGWYSPDGGFNCYKYRNDFEKYANED